MIIENLGEKFYVPDEIGNDTSLSVADVFAYAIPYDEYINQINLDENLKRIAEINSEILDLEKEPDEVPNESKFGQIQILEEEKNKLLELTN